MVNLEQLIQEYGYLAIFVGTFLEGETIQILGGFAAHGGLLELPWVILVGFAGTLLGDQLYFYIGRKHGQAFLDKRPRWRQRVAVVLRYVEKYHTLAILSFRFFYGIRNVASFAMGTSQLPFARFAVLNAIGAIIWAVVMACLGYFFGTAVEKIMGDIQRYEMWLLGGIAALGLLAFIVHVVRARRSG